MAGPTSFKKLLTKWCHKIEPKRILEWGPGESTIVMLEECAGDITTIEHDNKWYLIWKEKLDCGRCKLLLIPDDEDGPMDNYSSPPVKGKFDLIFVDGRQRVKCMNFAKEHLSPSGVVIVHDAERSEYSKGIDLFGELERDEDKGTVVLRLPLKQSNI